LTKHLQQIFTSFLTNVTTEIMFNNWIPISIKQVKTAGDRWNLDLFRKNRKQQDRAGNLFEGQQLEVWSESSSSDGDTDSEQEGRREFESPPAEMEEVRRLPAHSSDEKDIMPGL
jgi:hypothetical protein